MNFSIVPNKEGRIEIPEGKSCGTCTFLHTANLDDDICSYSGNILKVDNEDDPESCWFIKDQDCPFYHHNRVKKYQEIIEEVYDPEFEYWR
jgi:hypothetical protein